MPGFQFSQLQYGDKCVHILQLSQTIGPQHSLFANVFCQLQSTRQTFSSLNKSRRQWGSKLLSLTTSECPSWPCRCSQSVRPLYSICLMLRSLVLKAHRVTPFSGEQGPSFHWCRSQTLSSSFTPLSPPPLVQELSTSR